MLTRTFRGLQLIQRGGTMKTLTWLGALASLLLPAAASAVTIDFDALATGTYTEAQFNAMFGATFDNTTDTGFQVSNAVNNPLFPAFSAPNAVLNTGFDNPANTTRVTFNSVVSFASVTMGDFDSDADVLHLVAYDSSSAVIGSDVLDYDASRNDGAVLSVSTPGIAAIEFWGDGLGDANNVYWDNLTWSDERQVPEPAMLFLVALSLVGVYVAGRKGA